MYSVQYSLTRAITIVSKREFDTSPASAPLADRASRSVSFSWEDSAKNLGLTPTTADLARPKVVWTEPTSEQSTVDAACAAAAGWAAFLLAKAACGLATHQARRKGAWAACGTVLAPQIAPQQRVQRS